MTEPGERARRAAARAAVDELREGETIGLGSGRAVMHVLEQIAARWPRRPPLRAVCASNATQARADALGIERVELDGTLGLTLALDGADEVDPQLGLVKGAGAALLREKLVAGAAERFVVVAEASKRVERLGATRPLPVEVVRFAWRETRRRLLDLTGEVRLRTVSSGEPLITDEGHYLLDCALPAHGDLGALACEIKACVGVVDHGLFLDMADLALLGTDAGGVERIVKP